MGLSQQGKAPDTPRQLFVLQEEEPCAAGAGRLSKTSPHPSGEQSPQLLVSESHN